MSTFRLRPSDSCVATALTGQGLPAPLARALAARGIRSASELTLEMASLAPPSTLPGTQEAARMLADAIESKTRCVIIGDYDCDGATATAVGIRGLRAMGADVSYIIPDRAIDGYGLTVRLVDKAIARGATLLVTVDNGISANRAIDYAKERGMAVIVTDHHLQPDELPKADVIVNPALRGSRFASPFLAGCGVMLYVLLALRGELRSRHPGWKGPNLASLLDLVAIGTVADVVPFDENNRILVSAGLKRIRAGRMQPGVAALWSRTRYRPEDATTETIGFRIAPRINAAGRIDNMEAGVECLITDSPDAALALADSLESTNQERRTLEEEAAQQARSQVASINIDERMSLVAHSPDWHAGIVGLIAGDLTRLMHRPSFAFTRSEDGAWRGSGRSVPGLHLRDTLADIDRENPGMIVKFGGHAGAAGLTVVDGRLEEFTVALETVVERRFGGVMPSDVVLTDGPLAPDEITADLAEAIEDLPWGNGFTEPLWQNRFRIIHQSLVAAGTLRLVLQAGRSRFTAIWFRHGSLLEGNEAAIAYRIRMDRYRGGRNVQLLVEAAG